jgi:hypothetical protein
MGILLEPNPYSHLRFQTASAPSESMKKKKDPTQHRISRKGLADMSDDRRMSQKKTPFAVRG